MAKILLGLHQFFPRFYTGTETLTMEVAEELNRRGHEVIILTAEPLLEGDDSPVTPELRKGTYGGLRVWRLLVPHPVDELERLDRESNDYKVSNLYEQLITEEAPDIVHIFHLMRLTMSFVEVVKKHNIPVYFTSTDFWILCPTYQLIREDDSLCDKPDPVKCYICLLSMSIKGMAVPPWSHYVAKFAPRLSGLLHKRCRDYQVVLKTRMERHQSLMGMFDAVFWPNSFIRDMFHRNGLRCKTEKIISFPVPEKAKALFELPSSSKSGVLRVAFIGTLRPSKGPQVLIKALKKVGKDVPIAVSIWGAPEFPEYLDTLKNIADGDIRISFKGTFPQEKFADVLSEIDVVVMPALWYENTPLTALSVLAARRVLVVSNLGGLASLVADGRNGFLFPPGDTTQLARILTRLALNHDLIKEIGTKISPPIRVTEYVDNILKIYFRKSFLAAKSPPNQA